VDTSNTTANLFPTILVYKRIKIRIIGMGICFSATSGNSLTAGELEVSLLASKICDAAYFEPPDGHSDIEALQKYLKSKIKNEIKNVEIYRTGSNRAIRLTGIYFLINFLIISSGF
jgi:hypothetical protein